MLLESGSLREPSVFLPRTAESKPLPTLLTVFEGRPSERLGVDAALFWQGDDARDVFVVVQGAVRIVRVLSDGRRVVTGFIFAGELAGAGAGEQYQDSAEAVVQTQVRRCSRRRFEDEIRGSPYLHRQYVDELHREMAAAREHVVLLARKTAEERISSFLLSMMMRRTNGRAAPANTLHLPIARTDIADHLGLTIATVSRTMTRLRELGVIVQIGRHTTVVRQPRRLAGLAANDGICGDDEIPLCSN